MAVPKLFLTGVTGYIGGDAFYTIHTAHPDWDYTALVRDSDKGALVASAYPSVKLIYATLDDGDVLGEAAKDADIVMHFADADSVNAANAFASGLKARSARTPGFLIHTSGTGVLVYPDMDRNIYGEASKKVWDDIADIADINEIPDHAPHRKIDQLVLNAQQGPANSMVRTAIVSPPTIYGRGRGPGNQRSVQLPQLSRQTLKRSKGFYVGDGENRWSEIHVQDLSNVYLRLAEEAASGGGSASWGREGYYFVENSEFIWSEVSREVAKTAKKLGYVETEEVDSLSADDVGKMITAGAILLGSNSRSKASRPREVLGWKPVMPGLVDYIEEGLKVEKNLLDRGINADF